MVRVVVGLVISRFVLVVGLVEASLLVTLLVSLELVVTESVVGIDGVFLVLVVDFSISCKKQLRLGFRNCYLY